MSLDATSFATRRKAPSLPRTFPRTVSEAHEFLARRLLNASAIDDELLSAIVDKLSRNTPLSAVEIFAMRRVTDIGDTCTCDTDHRIRDDDGMGGREVTFSSM